MPGMCPAPTTPTTFFTRSPPAGRCIECASTKSRSATSVFCMAWFWNPATARLFRARYSSDRTRLITFSPHLLTFAMSSTVGASTWRKPTLNPLFSTSSSSAGSEPQPASYMSRRASIGKRNLTGIDMLLPSRSSICRSSVLRRMSSRSASDPSEDSLRRSSPRSTDRLSALYASCAARENHRFQTRDVVTFMSRSPSTTSAPTSFAASIAARNSAPGVVPKTAPTSA
mmetsp:Transcript_4269/g.19381  ORF Transcript_4269/g.19381 Transcript_4269/m.19381 type:complete len:228 (-) Transcript_4269:770-1453(-)